MFKILINNEITAIFLDDGMDGIRTYEDNIIGVLFNQEGIKELIESMPISKYYIESKCTPCKEITRDKALLVYDKLIEYQAQEANKKLI